jgi:hypothetical protein
LSVAFGIITSVVPPGSWHYPQLLSSGQTVRIASHSLEQLLAEMLEFRRRHLELCGGAAKATIEACRADLKDYICQHFRQNCADSPAGPVVTARVGIGITNYQRPIDRAADWLAKITAVSISKVDAALASHRAHICATCPQNVHWETGCAPCNDNVLVRTQNAKGSAHTPYDRSLFACRIHGWVNEVAVWLERPQSQAAAEQKAPPICWHHELSKGG